MGLRGPGAKPKGKADKPTRRLPWKKRGLSRVERVVAFMEFLPITKGILQGSRMKLLPEQGQFIDKVYGDVDENGRRNISLAISSMARGSGKSGLLSGLALCHLLGPEAEPRGEIYS